VSKQRELQGDFLIKNEQGKGLGRVLVYRNESSVGTFDPLRDTYFDFTIVPFDSSRSTVCLYGVHQVLERLVSLTIGEDVMLGDLAEKFPFLDDPRNKIYVYPLLLMYHHAQNEKGKFIVGEVWYERKYVLENPDENVDTESDEYLLQTKETITVIHEGQKILETDYDYFELLNLLCNKIFDDVTILG